MGHRSQITGVTGQATEDKAGRGALLVCMMCIEQMAKGAASFTAA